MPASATRPVVWITGASSGIGEALAYVYSRRGARCVLSARRAERLEAVRRACDRPADHLVCPLDLTEPGTFADATRQVLDRYGAIDVLVNNGGLSQRGHAAETDLAVDRHIMEVNYFGAIGLTKAVLPSMRDRRSGRIVVVSSLVGKFSTPGRSAYAASKHALHGFFDALRAEVWDEGLRVTIACPGYVRTEVSVHALRPDGSEHGRMDAPQQHGLDPLDCAAQIADAAAAERDEVYIGGKEVAAVYLKRFAPRLFNVLIRKVMG